MLEGGHNTQDMQYAKIATLYKNKRERSDCNIYRGIVGKAFARVVLNKLQLLLIAYTRRRNVGSAQKGRQSMWCSP